MTNFKNQILVMNLGSPNMPDSALILSLSLFSPFPLFMNLEMPNASHPPSFWLMLAGGKKSGRKLNMISNSDGRVCLKMMLNRASVETLCVIQFILKEIRKGLTFMEKTRSLYVEQRRASKSSAAQIDGSHKWSETMTSR